MIPLSTNPGLISRIEKGWMHVKVPVGTGCHACARKSQCTFSGPRRAYRTFRVRRLPECQVGDRVLVDILRSALTIAGIVLVIVPVLMIFGGYWLLQTWLRFPDAMPLLWLVGITAWLLLLFAVNKWIERSARFNQQIRPLGGPRG
jgi:positive regulator of sigma E activity